MKEHNHRFLASSSLARSHQKDNEMKRFRLGTLMLLIAIAAYGFTIPEKAREILQGGAELEFKLAEVHRVLMIVIAASCFALAKRTTKESRRGSGLDVQT